MTTDALTTTSIPVAPVSRRVIWTMAVATGTVVANLYYAQPLEATLARQFHAPTTSLGLIVTVLQLGYAVGLATILPLGDLLDRRRLLVTLLSAVVVSMTVMALAPSLTVFAGAAAAVGLACVAVQVIIPFAAQLAAGGQQGRIVSTVISGLLLGILLSRTVSGIVAQAFGWRAVFGLGATATALIAVLLWRELPSVPPTTRMRYPALVASVFGLVRSEPVLRWRMAYGALTFSSFSVFWTSAAFLLSGSPYHWNDAAIGTFALLGVAGALIAQLAGRLADRGHAHLTTGVSLAVMALSYLLIAPGAHTLIPLAVGAILMDMGSQGTHISNQTLIYRLRADARSRLNTAYMVAYFIGGSLGSASSTAAYHQAGWAGVSVLGAAFPATALLLWVLETVRQRRRSRVPPLASSLP
jgi:predicted MFS family arabinose efflux permease